MTELRFSPSQLRALDRQKEHLVSAAEQLLLDAEILAIPQKDLGHSQLKNLLAMAAETESPKVVTSFVRYQMGRDSHSESWARRNAAGHSFGELLIAAVESGAVLSAVDAAASEVDGLEGPLRQMAHVHMLRHFLGFMGRYLKYLESSRAQRSSKPSSSRRQGGR